MKLTFVIISVVVLCLVEDGSCGVIGDVYGNVKNRTVAIKDGVTGWLAYGKDWVLGTNEKPLMQGRSGDEVIVNDSLYSQIYNKLLNGFQSARDTVYGFFISDEKVKSNGFISNLYDRVKHRITRITAYVVGEDQIDPKEVDDLSEIRRALNTMINHQKSLREGQIRAGADGLKDKVEQIGEKLHDGVTEMRDNVLETKKSPEDRVSQGINSASDSLNKGVVDAKEAFSSTLNDWQRSGVEISEKEREVLNAIANRVRERIIHTQDVIENPKQLSYAEENKDK